MKRGAHNKANANWSIHDAPDSWTQVAVAVLMDIREELRGINAILECPNFGAIPFHLDKIRMNTTKKKRRKKRA